MAKWKRPATLGVDIGGVIVVQATDDVDTSFFGTRPLETPATEGVFEHLAALAAGPFAGRVHLISKAGPKVAGNSRAWLEHHDFYGRTGVPEANLRFVRERRDKAPICRRLGVTHFVDDHLDVLAHLETVDYRYLFAATRDDLPGWAIAVSGWADLAARIDPAGGQRA